MGASEGAFWAFPQSLFVSSPPWAPFSLDLWKDPVISKLVRNEVFQQDYFSLILLPP